MTRFISVLTLLFTLAIGVTSSPAQESSNGKVTERKQPKAKSTEDKINDGFGVALGYLTEYPFYNIAPFFGLSTEPQLLKDDKGEMRPAWTELKGHEGSVINALFGPDGTSVLTIGADNTCRLYDLRGRQLTYKPHPAAIRDAAFFPGGGEFVTASADGKLRFFTEKKNGDDVTWTDGLTIDAHEGEVSRVWYSKDGVWLASLGTSGAIRLWDKKGARSAEFTDIADGVRGLAISSDTEQNNEIVLILDGAGTLRVAKANGTTVLKIEGQNIQAFTIADGESHVLLRLGADVFKIIELSGKDVGTVRHPGPAEIVASAIHVEGSKVEVKLLGKDRTRHTYDTDGNELAAEKDAATFADGFYTKAHDTTNTISLHQYRDDTVWRFFGHGDQILGSALAPDGTRAVTFSKDGTARIWEWFIRAPDGNPVVTNIPFVVLWLVVAAVIFTLFMKFVNFRMFGHAIQVVRGKFSNPDDHGEVSHFQALTSALSATVGLGNIAGVAIAVSVGGPGATFWMIVAGLLGMTLKFTECTLGQKFRKIDSQGRVSGGPMHYLKDGLRQKGLGILGVPLAGIFTVFCIGGSLAGGNAFQVNQSGNILKGQVTFFEENGWVYGVILAFFVGIVIIGGIRRIAQTAEKIVPTMCGIYVAAALTIIVMNIGAVPGAFGTIFESALSGDAIYGGALGALIMGFRRAAFSNEAGVGSASIAHSAARTPYAVREGIVALLEPFIDTVVVCTMTALVIVITGVYSADQFPEYTQMVASNNGAGLTAKAFGLNPVLAGWFPWVLMTAVILFAFSTMISWSYYGERCWTNLFGPKSSIYFKILFLAFTVLGSIVSATNVLEFGDVMILLMAFPNILGLYFLGGLVKTDLAEYEEKKRAGEFKVFK